MAKRPRWLRVFELIEADPQPLTNARIQTFKDIDGILIDVPWLSRHLWAASGSNIGNDIHMHRVAYAGGEEYNGFEFRRRLYNDYAGGASEVALAGIRSLHAFPRCPGPHLLSRYIGTLQIGKNQHGSSLPDEHLRSMC